MHGKFQGHGRTTARPRDGRCRSVQQRKKVTVQLLQTGFAAALLKPVVYTNLDTSYMKGNSACHYLNIIIEAT